MIYGSAVIEGTHGRFSKGISGRIFKEKDYLKRPLKVWVVLEEQSRKQLLSLWEMPVEIRKKLQAELEKEH